MEWYIIIVQIIFTILLYLFTRYNYKKIDNWLVVLVGLLSLVPILGGIIIFVALVWIFSMMADEDDLSDTKMNRFLFRSKFEE